MLQGGCHATVVMRNARPVSLPKPDPNERLNLSMANCQIGLSAVVFEVLIPLPECATSLSYSFI